MAGRTDSSGRVVCASQLGGAATADATRPKPSHSCDLCGLPLIGRPLRASDREFCCEGCKRVWTAADASGISELLSSPDDRRSRTAGAGARKAEAAAAAGARRETLRVTGMWCASCALVVEDALLGLPGVLDAEVSYAAALTRVTWDPSTTDRDAIIARVAVLGYDAEPARLAATGMADSEDVFLRFFVGAALSMWVMWPTLFLLYPAFAAGRYASVQQVSAFTGLLALPVLLYSGWPFLIGAWRASRVGRATMDTLVVLGTWTAFAYSAWATATASGPTYFESAAMITTIVLLGRWLESLGRRDAARSLAALAATEAAEEAWLLGDAEDLASAQRVPLTQIAPGALVAVRAGERVPVDGVVLRGDSELDRARLTGESLPARVAAGGEVWAGAINLAGTLVVRADRVGSETLSGRLSALAEDAVFAKSSAQRLADTVAGVFVPLVLAIAAATLLIGGATGSLAEGVSRAVAVLVVACPCALGLATPLAVVNAVGAGARRGLLIRGGVVLERAGELKAIAFDKTGTLTEGRLSVVAALLPPGSAEDSLLAVAVSLEAGDPHPVAAAVIARAESLGIEPLGAADVVRVAGQGLQGTLAGGQALVGSEALLAEHSVEIPKALTAEASLARAGGNVVVWVARGGALLGGIVLADRLREEAYASLAALRKRGIALALVSGDAAETTASVSATVGADAVFGDVLPHDKERVVREWAAEVLAAGPGAVAFVGDGVNDTAALAAADIAVSIADASDVAQLAADVVLASPQRPLAALPALASIASASRRIIRENLLWAFSYNLVTVPLAVLGVLSPITAAAAMALSSLAVVANSWRLRFAGRS